MNNTTIWSFEHQPSPEEEEVSFNSFGLLWILLIVVIAMTCWVCCAKVQKEPSWDIPSTPPSREPPQSTSLRDRLFERERISAANRVMEALLNRNNTTGVRREPLPAVNDWPVPNRYTTVRASAPPANTTPDHFAPPPSYHQLETSDRSDSDLQHAQQTLTAQFEDRGYSNTARVLADCFNRSRPQSSQKRSERGTTNRTDNSVAIDVLPRLQTRPPRRKSYFKLRGLTSNSGTRNTSDETDVTPTRHQRRPQTPPPTYHEVEETPFRIARADRLPSYDDFMATPLRTHLQPRSQTPPPTYLEIEQTAVRIARADSLPSYDDLMATPLRTHLQPRPQTPPPTYHEIEQTAVRIARADSLPSYDDLMATPLRTHLQPRPQTPPPTYHEIEQTAIRIARADSLPSYDDLMATLHEYTT